MYFRCAQEFRASQNSEYSHSPLCYCGANCSYVLQLLHAIQQKLLYSKGMSFCSEFVLILTANSWKIGLLLQWFRNGEEIYRLVPEARWELRRMVFNPATVKIDIESSKVRHLSSSTGGLDSIQWNKTNFSKVLCQD